MSFTRKDVEELKPAIERCAERLLGSKNPEVVTLALTCLERGFDKKRTSTKIASLVGDSQSNKFTEKLYSLYDDYVNMLVQDRKRKRELTVGELAGERDENKKPKVSQNSDGVEAAGAFTPDKIKEMMANAQKLIQQRKNQLNIVTPQPALEVVSQQAKLMAEASEKMKSVSELKAKIQARISSSGLTNAAPPPVTPMTGPTPLVLDEFGRTFDPTTGLQVQMQLHTPTLKANIRAKKKEQFRTGQEKSQEESSHTKFFDFRLNAKPVVRTKKTFKFFEPGKFEKIGQRMRTKAHLEKLQNEVSLAAKKTGIATAAKLAIIQPKQESSGEVPDVEWWDAIVITSDRYPDPSELPEHPSQSPNGPKLPINYEIITNLVEHPIQMKPPVDTNTKVDLVTMLTKKERKKMRKQNRSEIQKEMQEKIRLGLLPPPEPKVRMANLMRVLGTEAVQDPTKVEAHVRAQMAKRQKAHEDANAARKLTKEQRRDKKIKKIKEDTSNGVVVSVYRVGDLSSPQKKFKVEANANQLFMTGIVILHKDCNVIVVEGGPKQQKKFRRLVMNRIKWGKERNKMDKDDDDDDEDEADAAKTNDCKLIWEGTVKSRAFGEIKFKVCPTEAFAREQFRKHSVEHYWDLAFSSTILETTLSNN